MGIFEIALILATFLCSLVAGLVFVFAVVVMPGIGSLNDREFIRAFQVIDGVIQNNQPAFVFVWIGSAVALVTSAVLRTTNVVHRTIGWSWASAHNLGHTHLSSRRPVADRHHQHTVEQQTPNSGGRRVG